MLNFVTPNMKHKLPDSEASKHTQATILVIDDSPDVIAFINEILRNHFQIKAAPNSQIALKIASNKQLSIDLILLDVVMGDMSGYELFKQLQEMPHLQEVPIIFLTALSDNTSETTGLRMGAVDYIRKPINGEILLKRIHNQVELKRARCLLQQQNDQLENEINQRTRENEQIQDITIMTLASLAETRDNETGNHILRTKNYVRILAEALKDRSRFRHYLTPKTIQLLYKSAPLHDIGKVGIPDSILLKPGKLTPQEFEIMKTHAVLGREAISKAEAALGFRAEFLNIAKEIAGSHHEKWDGSGYPQGLSGDAIPISARLMAIADVYDALISRRCYKEPIPHKDVLPILQDGASNHFDPEIVEVFIACANQIDEIAKAFSDGLK